jgi:hypothetical protein
MTYNVCCIGNACVAVHINKYYRLHFDYIFIYYAFPFSQQCEITSH